MDPAAGGMRPRGRARGRTRPRSRSRSPVRPGLAPGNAAPAASHQVGGGNWGQEFNRPPQAPSRSLVPLKKFDGNKKGAKGTPIPLQANFFRLCSVPQFTVYQFSVQFEPDEDRTFVRKALFNECRSHLGVATLFSGTILYTSRKLAKNPFVLQTMGKDGRSFKITINFVKQLQFGDSQYNIVFNMIWKKVMHLLNLKPFGKNYYDPEAMKNIPEYNLQLWPGYITTVRQHESELLLSAGVIHKVMRTETALDVINRILKEHGPQQFQVRVKEALLGSVVVTMFNNRNYRIDDISFDECPTTTFSYNGGEISFIDYYRTKYQIEIRHHNQPMLISKNKERLLRTGQGEQPIYLIPEMCCMTGMSDEMRKNFQLMRRVADYTRTSPSQKINQLVQFAQRLLTKPQIVQELNNWNMRITPSLIRFSGRVLPRENIVQGMDGNRIFDSGPQVDWTRNIQSNPALKAMPLSSWVAVYPLSMEQTARTFLETLGQVGSRMGIRMNGPQRVGLQNDNLSVYVNEIQKILSHTVPDILVCFVRDDRGDRYSAIKKLCCVDRNIITQVVTNRSITGRNTLSIATKIIMQMNCKVGGSSWSVSNPPGLQGTMVVGFDVSKDTINRGIAFGALVASMNDQFSSYHSQPIESKKGADLSSDICEALLVSLQVFEKRNGTLPKNIVFYRDGVDEFGDVLSAEVERLKEMLEMQFKGPDYQFTYILVSRRCNTRLFQNGGNPPAGTVVDDTITLPEKFDFYLISQSVRQGTVNPTSYQVLFNNSKLSACQIQRLTYKLTHLYYNWSGTIKVPAPVQYARKFSTLISQSLHKLPNPDLNDYLYYL